MRMLTIATACVLVAAGAHAQEPRQRVPVGEGQAGEVRLNVGPRVVLEHAVKGAPYSADTLSENTQTLADGNRIARKVTGRVYRDGEGRIRREEDHADGTVAISIFDPVANVSYRLEPQARVAWKSAPEVGFSIMTKVEEANAGERRPGMITLSPEDPSGRVAVSVRTGPEAPPEKKTIDGIAVEGRKTTVTIPAGRIGNDLPITITSEEWRSPDLQILILTRYSDPRMGESTYRVTNVVKAEPDPSLFLVPPGYTVREAGVRRHEQQK